jgi:hypothetical protein
MTEGFAQTGSGVVRALRMELEWGWPSLAMYQAVGYPVFQTSLPLKSNSLFPKTAWL